jgi:hypothetical protein
MKKLKHFVLLSFAVKILCFSKCPPGFVSVNDNGQIKCMDCPVNHECSKGYPILCPSNYTNLGRSDFCCAKNTTCPKGMAVYPHLNCECGPKVCYGKKFENGNSAIYKLQQTNMYFEANHRDVGCLEVPKCNQCIAYRMTMLDGNSCSCVSNEEICMNSSKEQYWFNVWLNKFKCIVF